MTMTNPLIDLYSIYQPARANGWLVSDWAAGQTSIMDWEQSRVRTTANGVIEMELGASRDGGRPYEGAEFQSSEVATTGTWSWTAQAPKMVDGAVFGMFTYKADWKKQPWVEFDFEFVGRDTTKVQLNIHMEDANGRHISLAGKLGRPVIVDLGFDASKGMHTYDVVVTDKTATFRVDGKVVGVYGAADMPGGVWQIGPQKSYVDLWCASGLESWTGKWAYDGTPLVAKVQGADVRPGDLSGALAAMPGQTPAPSPAPAPVTERIGDGTANAITGNDGDDSIAGNGGNDTLAGGNGNDTLSGGDGNDLIRMDAGNDVIDGGAGSDWIVASGAMNVELANTSAQATRYGNDTIRNVENVQGGDGDNLIRGDGGANILRGNGGDDRFWGRAGSDTIHGGTGDDTLTGGVDHDLLYAEDGTDRLTLDAGNDLLDGGSGADWVVVNGGYGATVDLSRTTAQNTGYGNDTLRNIENAMGNAGADRLAGNSLGNQLVGHGGNDTLSGGTGADTLDGGAGRDELSVALDGDRDVFVFRAASDSAVGNHDRINGFVAGVDDIDLRGIDPHAGLGGNQTFGFSGMQAAAHAVWTVTSGDDLLVRGDVTGDRVADFEILLTQVSALNAGDLIL
ncbi:MAG: hypothetical protein RIR62_2293 [Pseudomonadota bacterium]